MFFIIIGQFYKIKHIKFRFNHYLFQKIIHIYIFEEIISNNFHSNYKKKI